MVLWESGDGAFSGYLSCDLPAARVRSAVARTIAVARQGSMAAAARELGLVPSALTYRVRQIEDALDVLLFDRSARRAQLTPAGAELLRAGQYLLDELDAVAQRVKRIATGWEPQLTIAADAIIARSTLFELCEAFYALGAPTQLKLRAETLTGTWESVLNGSADLALGVAADLTPSTGIALELSRSGCKSVTSGRSDNAALRPGGRRRCLSALRVGWGCRGSW